MKKTLKKITCGILAAVSVFGCAATLTACETSHPEVEMKVEFNGETYTLDYKLYRELAPQTVKHFLWFAYTITAKTIIFVCIRAHTP